VAYTVVYLALAALAITSFHQAMELARGIVDSLVEFMVALLPLLTTLLAGVGAVTSAGVLHPLILLVANLVSIVAADIVLPLLFLAAVVKIVDRFHEGVRVSRVADLLQQGAVTVLGLTMSLFLGVITVQGAASAVVDGVGVRSAKFASKAFVPVLGSMFSDTVELMAGSSLLLKNAASIYGLVAVVVLTLYPALKLIGLIFSYRVAAALIQPIDDGPVVGLLGSMAGSLTVLTVCAGTVMVMFFLVLTITAGLGNATVMLR
jgi:stage III sporulation protein AE